MTDTWKVNAFALATTTGVAYVLCALFDLLKRRDSPLDVVLEKVARWGRVLRLVS